MYNNITSGKAPGLEPYEVSVFLTRGQNQLVADIFDPRANGMRVGFDGSIIRQSDFSTLVKSDTMKPYSQDGSSDGGSDESTEVFDNRETTRRFYYPSDMFLSLNEEVFETVGNKKKVYVVVPISFDEYARLMTQVYKYPAKGQAWRLINTYGDDKICAELIARFDDDGSLDYRVRYVRKPKPIILEDLTPLELTIDGEDQPMMTELPEHLHLEIINRAVALAKIAWIDTVSQQNQ